MHKRKPVMPATVHRCRIRPRWETSLTDKAPRRASRLGLGCPFTSRSSNTVPNAPRIQNPTQKPATAKKTMLGTWCCTRLFAERYR
jgi:hypothetical protein